MRKCGGYNELVASKDLVIFLLGRIWKQDVLFGKTSCFQTKHRVSRLTYPVRFYSVKFERQKRKMVTTLFQFL